MKKEIDFSQGVRGKYAGKKLRIIGDPKKRKAHSPLLTEREMLRQKIAALEALVAQYEAERKQILEVLGVELAAK